MKTIAIIAILAATPALATPGPRPGGCDDAIERWRAAGQDLIASQAHEETDPVIIARLWKAYREASKEVEDKKGPCQGKGPSR